MANKKVFTVQFRRKRQGKTDYKRRLALLKSKTLRLVVRKSNQHLSAQLVKYADKGDNVLVAAHTKELKKYGWDINTGNIPSAYLCGFLLGKKAKGKEAILDLGLQSPIKGSRLFAVLVGAKEGGLKINFSEEILPDKERLEGAHIKKYASTLKKDEFEKRFSGYLKNKKSPEDIKAYLDKAKEKILKD